MQNSASPQLLYIYDALCGWCYGFNPALGEFLRKHPDLPITVVSGGMIRGERRGQLSEVAAYIRTAYLDVEKATGTKFGKSFVDGPLQGGDFYMTSEPPAAILACVKTIDKSMQYPAAQALQQGIYYHGYAPDSNELPQYVAKRIGLDAKLLTTAANSPNFIALAEDDFKLTSKLGVRGFPALLYAKDGQLEMLTNGYANLTTLENKINQFHESEI